MHSFPCQLCYFLIWGSRNSSYQQFYKIKCWLSLFCPDDLLSAPKGVDLSQVSQPFQLLVIHAFCISKLIWVSYLTIFPLMSWHSSSFAEILVKGEDLRDQHSNIQRGVWRQMRWELNMGGLTQVNRHALGWGRAVFSPVRYIDIHPHSHYFGACMSLYVWSVHYAAGGWVRGRKGSLETYTMCPGACLSPNYI